MSFKKTGRLVRANWWQLYFVLAAFDLITISFSLYLNHSLIRLQDQSVTINQEWAARQQQFAELSQLASDANAPGNDVFQSRDVKSEFERLIATVKNFHQQLAEVESVVLAKTEGADLVLLKQDIALMRGAMSAMTAEAEAIFGFLGQGEESLASDSMAKMDQKYSKLNRIFLQVGNHIRSIQAENFRTQQAEVAKLSRYEFAIAGSIVVIVLAVTIYGHRMAREMSRILSEREQNLVALEASHQELEMRVTDRTRELREKIDQLELLRIESEEAHQKLVVTSRQAGMAEVSTGVLHNVGNALNSVNVSATLLIEKVMNSPTSTLAEAAALLRNNKGNLSAFLTENPKGRQLPDFFDALSSHMSREKDLAIQEAHSLATNVEHIKQIVIMHQSYVKATGIVECLQAKELIEDALQIVAFGREKIEIIREFDAVPNVRACRHMAVSILVNLLSNARHALEDRTDGCCVSLQVTLRDGKWVSIRVTDNGLGISNDNLNRIFTFGYTTRKDGHGFGLHSSANAAKEMGGSLTANSEGLGKGAEFTLDLPVSETALLRKSGGR
jgi:C4-dicarboxylate-specific signal transduction histidine kinase